MQRPHARHYKEQIEMKDIKVRYSASGQGNGRYHNRFIQVTLTGIYENYDRA